MDDLKLKLPGETKDEFGFTPSQNKEIEEYLTRDTSKSKGMWNAYISADKDPNRPKNVSALDYTEQMKEKYGSYDNYTNNNNLKSMVRFGVENSSKKIGNAPPGSKQQKTDVLDYINKKVEMYEGGGVKIDPPILKDNINSKRYENKSLSKFENRTDDPNTVTFNPTTQLFTNKDRTIAFKDYNSADNYNKSLRVKPKYPTQASPEAFGKLAETLERDKQMRGAATNLKEFGHSFNENKKVPLYPGMKAWQKNKKISTPTEPVKIKLSTYTPFIPMDMPKPDPQMIESEKRFNRMKAEIDEEKKRINNSGLAALLGGVK